MRLAALFALLAARAWACSCAVSPLGNPPCQSAWQADAVFTGMVLEVDDPGMPIVRPGGPPPSRTKRVRFRVGEAFTGLAPKLQEVLVETGLGGGDCGYPFTRGRDYIVYAYQRNGVLSTGICSSTRPVEDAAPQLAYFHGLEQALPSA